MPSTTTNCQTTSQASNQLTTSYGKYCSERSKSKRSSKASKKFKQHKILLCFTLLVFLGVTFLIANVIAGSKRHWFIGSIQYRNPLWTLIITSIITFGRRKHYLSSKWKIQWIHNLQLSFPVLISLSKQYFPYEAQIQIPKVQQSPVQMPFSPPQNHLNK